MSDERIEPHPTVRQIHRGRHRGTDAAPQQSPLGADAGLPGDDRRAELEQLAAELEQARQEAAEARAAWQRSAADFANYKRRSEQARLATLGLANEALLTKLLAVADDFDRALAALPEGADQHGWVEGIWLVERKLRALLDSEGVTPIEALGKPFDPHEHEAISHTETDTAPDGTVLAEHQRGYRIRDRVLRPSLVTVANNPNTSPGPGGDR